ncbi:SGNH/GDSL hydrolase family protein [Mycoplasmoides fastidiosum]|uniref:SGNH/GDSL hydrolase family protein n=2 Tax=Mycoplasmoides fastidiosum TaxID=92758 RepID=UPI0027D78B93|nr:SGNH/GDSL hydrolase family protein [Mycoplasmoides fastidiosum]
MKSKFWLAFFSLSSSSAFVLSACSDALNSRPKTLDTPPEHEKPNQTNDNQVPLELPKVTPPATDSNVKDEAAEYAKNRIRYVALGDSITAGYNGDLAGIDTSGQFNFETKQIVGWSYPSYFASYVEQTQPGSIGSYHNLGLSGSTIDDWLYLLGDNVVGYNPTSRSALFNSFKKDNEAHKNPYANRFSKYFGENENAFKPTGFNKSLEKIKDATLITITLSANDFFNKFPFFNLFNSSTNFSSIQSQVESIAKQIENNYVKLIQKISSLNPRARIVLLNYPKPLLRLSNLLETEIAKISSNLYKNGEKITVFQTLFDRVNKISFNTYKHIDDKNNVDFISAFNQNFWEKYAKDLSHNIFDIHPTKFGQKQMGLELFLKLSKTTTDNSDSNPFWKESNNYKNEDANTFKKFLKFNSNINLQKLISNYVAKDNKPIVLLNNLSNDINSDLEKIEKQKNWSYPLKYFLNNLNIQGNVIYSKIKSFIFLGEIESNELDAFLIKKYDDKSNLVHLINFFLKDKSFFNGALNKSVEMLDNLENQNFTKEILETNLKKSFQNDIESNFLNLAFELSDLSKEKFIKEQITEIQELIKPNKKLNTIFVHLLKQFLPTFEFIKKFNFEELVKKSDFETKTQKFVESLLAIILLGKGSIYIIPSKLNNYIKELNAST